MLHRLFPLLLFWTPAVVVLSALACTTRITRYILSTTVSNVLFLLDLFYLSLLACIALVVHTRFIPLQLSPPHSALINSTAVPPPSSSLLLPPSPPPSNLRFEEARSAFAKEEEEDRSSFSTLSRIPRRSKSQSLSILPRRPPPPPPPSPQTHNSTIPPPILTTSISSQKASDSSPPHQQHRVRFTSLPSFIAQDPRSRVVSPLASQLLKTEEAFFLPSESKRKKENGSGKVGTKVGNGMEEEARMRMVAGKGKEREREREEEKPMTPPSSPEIETLARLPDEEGEDETRLIGIVGGSAARRRRKAVEKSAMREESGGVEERGKDGLGVSASAKKEAGKS